MKLRDLNRALNRHGCYVETDTGNHTKWICPCGMHSANIPRHTLVSPGVVRDPTNRMTYLPKGWLL